MCKVNFNRLKLQFDFGNIGFDEEKKKEVNK